MSKFSKLSSRPGANQAETPTTPAGSPKPALPKATSTRSLKNALIVRVEMVKPNAEQVRKKFDQKALNELAEDIRERGILEPLIVREVEPGEYQIVAGERRYQAACAIGLTELPVIVRDLNDKEARFVQLAENLQRQDLDPTDEAAFFRTLQNEYNYSITDLARMISKSRDYVRDRLDGRLQKMQEEDLSSGTDSEVLHNTRQNRELLEKSQNVSSETKKTTAKSKEQSKFNPAIFTRFNQLLDNTLDYLDEQEPDSKTRLKLEKTLEEMEKKISQLKRKLNG